MITQKWYLQKPILSKYREIVTCAKARIEKAAKLDGVSKAEWDAKSNILTVTFDPAKTNMDQISKKVAVVGHDNSKVKSDDKAYNALPGCCKYARMN